MKCWKCGNEFDTPFCPVCGAQAARPYAPRARKRHKPWYKKWWIWLLGSLVLFFSVPFTIGGIQAITGIAPSKTTPTPQEQSILREVPEAALEAEPPRPFETLAAAPLATPTLRPTETPAPSLAPTSTPAPSPSPEQTAEATATPEPVIAYIDANSLNMRSEPSRDGDIVQEYSGGQSIEIIGEEGDWYKVAVGGASGYMLKEYVGIGSAAKKTEAPLTRTLVNAEEESAQATAEATPKPTAEATEKPRPSPVLENFPDRVHRNEIVTFRVHGEPNTNYHAEVLYKSGLSVADGLGTTVSDGNGIASWTWKIGGRTSLDYDPTIIITGNNQTIKKKFDVVE